MKCFYCKKEIEEGEKYLKVGKFHFHSNCLEDFKNINKEKTVEQWKSLLYYYIKYELVQDYQYFMIEKQFDRFIKEGYTAKGIYCGFYYFHSILKREYRQEYGIGIIPSIYEDMKKYYERQYFRNQTLSKPKEIIGSKLHIKNKYENKRKVSQEPI